MPNFTFLWNTTSAAKHTANTQSFDLLSLGLQQLGDECRRWLPGPVNIIIVINVIIIIIIITAHWKTVLLDNLQHHQQPQDATSQQQWLSVSVHCSRG